MPFLSVRNLIWSAFFVLFASSAVAEIDQTYQVYEKNGDYYLKTDPTWVPIGVSNFVIIPVYEEGDFLKLVQDGNGWAVETITQSAFNTVAPTLVSDGAVDYADINGDGILDLNIYLGSAANGQYVYVTPDNSGSFSVYVTNPTLPSFPEEAPAIANATLSGVPGNIVGTINGQFRVDESGAATYSIPIELPSGIAGVTPELGLNYSSQGGNGHMGMGWNISGLSSISRCRATYEQDGFDGALKNDTNDRFCLNGQKLILVSSNVDYGDSGAEYRTEIDSMQRIISHGSLGTGPAYFTVEAIDGSTTYYGETANSRLVSNGNAIQWRIARIQDNMELASSEIDFTYEITTHEINGVSATEVTIDTVSYSGNTVDFQYNSSAGRIDTAVTYILGKPLTTQSLLEAVEVSNHDNNRLRKYSLIYETGNSWENPAQRLVRVDHCGTTDSACLEPTTFVWNEQEHPSYTDDPVEYDLESDQVFSPTPADLNNDGFADFVFAKEGSGNFFTVMVAYNDQGILGKPRTLFSLRTTDLSNYPPRLIPADIDGDGHTEIVFYDESSDNYEWRAFDTERGTVSSLLGCAADTGNVACEVPESQFIELGVNVLNSSGANGTGKDIMFADIDADAYPDLIYNGSDGVVVQYNNRLDGFDAPINIQVPPAYKPAPGYLNRGYKLAQNTGLFDFNLDGKADFLVEVTFDYEDIEDLCNPDLEFQENCDPVPKPPIVKLGYYNNGKIEILAGSENLQLTNIDKLYTADINGDGISDLYTLPSNEDTSPELTYQLSDGNGQFLAPESISFPAAKGENVTSFSFVDVNKDFLPDAVYFDTDINTQYADEDGDGGWTTATQKSDGTFRAFNWQILSGLGTIDFDKNTQSAFMSDFNGDGDADFLNLQFVEVDNIAPFISIELDTISNNSPNTVAKIINGFGLETDITYELINHTDVYKRGVDADDLTVGRCYYDGTDSDDYDEYCSPVFDLISPTYVVAAVESDAPSTASTQDTLKVEYRYEGMRAQSGGRGMLGFEKVYTFDPDREVTTVTHYRQDFPFTGMPISTIQYLGGFDDAIAPNKTLSFAESRYELFRFNGGLTYYPYLKKSVQTQYAVNVPDVDEEYVTTLQNYTETTNTYIAVGDNHAILKSTATEIRASEDALYTKRVETENIYPEEEGELEEADVIDSWRLNRIDDSSVTHSRRNDSGVVTSIRQSQFTYNTTTGLLETETTAPGADSSLMLITKHCYDTSGNREATITLSNHFDIPECNAIPETVVTEDDPNKIFRVSLKNYDDDDRYVDSSGNLLFEMSQVTERNVFGSATISSDINGVVTNSAFDGMGALIETTNSLGQTSRVDRGYYGDLAEPTVAHVDYYYVERRRASGKQTSFAYFDVMGRQVASAKESFNGEYVFQVNHFDKFGQKVKSSKPFFDDTIYFETATYDKFNRLQSTKLTYASNENTTTSINYSDDGLTVTTLTTTDYNGESLSKSITQVNDVTGLNVSTSDTSVSGLVLYTYDATDSLVEVTNVDEAEITNFYDDYGRKTSMSDPDKGDWSYKYNALGELVEQQDAKGTVTVFYRDVLGRTVERSVITPNGSESTNYSYLVINPITGALEASHLLQSESLPNANQASKQYFYDEFGRVTLVRTQIDGDTYAQRTTYDEIGRVFQQFDPDSNAINGCETTSGVVTGSCWGLRNFYNEFGYLYKQEEAKFSGASASNPNRVVYNEILEMDHFGNVVQKRSNDNASGQGSILTTAVFDVVTGMNTSIISEISGANAQHIIFKYDGFGNLLSRNNIASGYTETFTYDDNFRLRGGVSTGPNAFDIATVLYDANGNIFSKSDVENGASYVYGTNENHCALAAGPHAVTRIGNLNYCYDENGNQTKAYDGSTLIRDISYHHFDKPSLIVGGGETTQFFYDEKRKRYKRVSSKNGGTETTRYIGNIEVIENSATGMTEIRRYLPGAIHSYFPSTGGVKTSYLLKDHIGSVDTIVNEHGQITEKLYFSPWGERKELTVQTNWSIQARSIAIMTLDQIGTSIRGYTGHEHVEHANIIHMNGRIYDPILGRFLQADPFIQDSDNSQSFNRYSYVFNNPLSNTDPTGYISLSKLISPLLRPIIRLSNKVFGEVLTNAVGSFIYYKLGGPAGAAYWSYNFTRTTGGSRSQALRGAFVSAAAAGAYEKIGQSFNGIGLDGNASQFFAENGVAHIASHALVGGVASVLNGGKFGHGFWSAGVTKWLTPTFEGAGGRAMEIGGYNVAEAVIAGILGGTISKVTGGKFANGAVSAAMGNLLNNQGLNECYGDCVTVTDKYGKRLRIPRAALPMFIKNSADEVLADQLGVSVQELNTPTKEDALRVAQGLAIYSGFGGIALRMAGLSWISAGASSTAWMIDDNRSAEGLGWIILDVSLNRFAPEMVQDTIFDGLDHVISTYSWMIQTGQTIRNSESNKE